MKKKILMIGTGGTIASKPTQQGLAPGLTSEDILSYIPQVEEFCQVDCVQISSIDSTNVTPEHWSMMTRTVQQNYTEYDGFVICHGTDTLAYTAAALSYMIQNSEKPIVITGSQKPIQAEMTDAKINLLDSFIYAADDNSRDVCIVFDGKVIVGTRAKKVYAKSHNAFASINFPYLAVIQNQKIIRYIPPVISQSSVRFYPEIGSSVFVLKMVPGLSAELLPAIFETYQCIVLESYGVGGVPTVLVDELYRQMEKYSRKEKIVVMTTQVVNEGSDMTIYKVGKQIKQDFNMIECYDMTMECVTTKMMWLQSLHLKSYEEIEQEFYREINHDILFHKEY